MKIQIRSIDFTADAKLHAHIEKKVQKVNRFFPKVLSADVSLKLENSGQIRDKICEIRLKIPGDLIVVDSTSKTFESAADNAVRTLKRRMVKIKERKFAR